MQDVCFGKLRSGWECSMSVSWVREGRVFQVYFLSMGWLYSSVLPVSLHPYCCSEDTALAWEPAWAACEPHTTEEPLVAHSCHFYEYKTGGKNHTKGNWWETPSLIAYTDTAYKLFGQGFIAANIYAEFCERSLLWCAATLIIEEKKTWASAAQGFGKCLMIFCPVTCFGKFARSKLTCVCLGEGRCQTCKAYSTTIFCRPGYFRNVAIGCSESHASLQKILDCVLVSSVSVWEFKSNEES